MSEQPCPCGLENYSHCCQPLHLGQQKAASAEQLMRSRYSAFARQEINYLIQTTALGQQQYLDVPAMTAWSESNHWVKLEIIQAQEKVNKNHASVEFKAHYFDGQQNQIHHELSYFVKLQNDWYFLDPTVEQPLTMKQACLCGSHQKFKQCCAQFL